MGLGFNTNANLTVGKSGLFSRARTVTMEDVRAACAAYVKGTPLAEMTSFGELWNGEPGFSFSLHPAEEGIDFKFDGTQVFARDAVIELWQGVQSPLAMKGAFSANDQANGEPHEVFWRKPSL